MKNIKVLMGGPSAEHEISLRTGYEMIQSLDQSRYAISAVVIDHDKKFWHTGNNTPIVKIPADAYRSPHTSAFFEGPFHPADCLTIWSSCTIALLALHGSFGEDGLIQGYLDTIGVPYTGSSVFSSAVGMNKIVTKQLLEQNGIRTPPYSIFDKNFPGTTIESIAKKHQFPCFVKCPQSGSSRLMGRAENIADLKDMITEFSADAAQILIETTITGDEYSCPVLTLPDGTVKALPPVLIKPISQTFFNYEAKYTDGACEEIVPAPCSDQLKEDIQRLSIIVHQLLGCSGCTRTDFIHQDNQLYCLEINTLPGLTPNSLTPKSFAAQGGSFPELLDMLIDATLHLKS